MSILLLYTLSNMNIIPNQYHTVYNRNIFSVDSNIVIIQWYLQINVDNQIIYLACVHLHSIISPMFSYFHHNIPIIYCLQNGLGLCCIQLFSTMLLKFSITVCGVFDIEEVLLMQVTFFKNNKSLSCHYNWNVLF